MLQNPAGTAARELCPGLQPATLQCSATCKFFTGASHKSKDRPRLPPPAFHTSARFSQRLSSKSAAYWTNFQYYHVIGVLLDKLVEKFAAVGVTIEYTENKNPHNTSPTTVHTPNGLIISVLDRESSHEWLGCMLTTTPAQTTTCDVERRLQAAAKAFNANRSILCDPKVSIAQKLECFDRVISPVACFAAGHRTF